MMARHIVLRQPKKMASDFAPTTSRAVFFLALLDLFVSRSFDRVNAWLVTPNRWIIVCLALMSVQITLALTHVAWQDEWQALFIAVQSPDFSALLENLRYEGHPPLWFLLLRAVHWVVPMQWTLPVTQAMIVLTMQALILSRAPFGRFERLLIAASYFVMFEFGVVSRSLSLGALLTVSFFAAHSCRWAWAAIITLPLVDFQFGLISLIAIVLMWRDQRWSWPGFALWLTMSLLAAASILPADDMVAAQDKTPVITGALIFLIRVSPMLVPIHIMDGNLHWNGGIEPQALGLIFGAIFLLFSLRLLRGDRLGQNLYAGFLLATMLLSTLLYSLGVRHLTLLPLMFILLIWRRNRIYGTALNPVFRLWLIVIAVGGVSSVAITIDRPFDTAPYAARYIENNNLESKNWISWPALHSTTVTGLIGIDFQPLGKKCTNSFVRWDRRDPIKNREELTVALEKVANEQGGFYLLTLYNLEWLPRSFAQPLFATPMGYAGNYYYIFRIAPGKPETAYRAPPCVPNRLPLDPTEF
jgi:hypothetical protein